MNITKEEQEILIAAYAGRQAYHGELHDHAATGGTSDGKRSLEHWKAAMEALHMDFAAILDHRQVRHMYLPEWDKELFLCGTEPGTVISGLEIENSAMHYNMLVPDPEVLKEILHSFPEYGFEGGTEGHFTYPEFTAERFAALIDRVKELGGFFVHPHPKQVMKSENPLDYWFRDETGLEVFYGAMDNAWTEENYALWTALLACGKRVWACAGGDGHSCADDGALTTVYSSARTNEAYLSHLRKGDFVCGPVGIRMCMGDTLMGGKCKFGKQPLILCIDDFHKSVYMPCHTYRVDILDETGVAESMEISCEGASWISLNVREDAAFYRAEVFDVTRGLRIAIGNPIWND